MPFCEDIGADAIKTGMLSSASHRSNRRRPDRGLGYRPTRRRSGHGRQEWRLLLQADAVEALSHRPAAARADRDPEHRRKREVLIRGADQSQNRCARTRRGRLQRSRTTVCRDQRAVTDAGEPGRPDIRWPSLHRACEPTESRRRTRTAPAARFRPRSPQISRWGLEPAGSDSRRRRNIITAALARQLSRLAPGTRRSTISHASSCSPHPEIASERRINGRHPRQRH